MNRYVAAAAVIAFAGAAAAEQPDFDAFYESSAVRPLSREASALIRQGQVSHLEERLGVPTFYWAAQEPKAGSLKAMGLSAEQAARRHLFDHAALYRLAPAALADSNLVRVHDTGRGAVIADFEQVVRGRPVFRDTLHVVMDQRLQLVALSGYLNPNTRPLASKWELSRATALAIAFSELTSAAERPEAFFEAGPLPGGYVALEQRGIPDELRPMLAQPARVKDVWFGLPEGLVPAYYVEVVAGAHATDAAYFAYVVSAADGRVLFRRSLTDYDSYSYRVWADPTTLIPQDGPQGDEGTPHPTGLQDGYIAPFVAPSLITLQNGPLSTQDAWLPKGATLTIGNNVEAYADRVAPDGFTVGSGDQHAQVNDLRTFDYTVNPGDLPNANSLQLQGAITQLFYTNNFVHDWYYDHGFDEQAGNAQADNFGRGGLDGDSLKAEAQDYKGLSNANMSTPADGSRPRMQLYVWSANRVSFLAVTAPANIAGTYAYGTASWGPSTFDITADAIYAQDTSGLYTGCVAFPAGSLAGKIAIIDRGVCAFTEKVQNAQAAGAVGAIIVNSSGTAPFGMGGTPTQPITIGALSLSLPDGAKLKAELAAGNTVTARLFLTVRDGTIDNAIVAHEWGHFISNRLVGNASGLSTQQARGMGEGWADFHALLLLVRESDAAVASNANFGGTYGTATFVADGDMTDGYYFGIRRAPYSVDFTKNGLTFKHIEDGVALPTTFPLAYGQSGASNSEVHATGEVWCSMLWEGYVGLLRAKTRLSFDQARDRMKDYLVAAYKATPNSPTFTEARDALLAVAYANDAADFTLLSQAFARRGAGIGAVSPPRTNTKNQSVTESFLTGKDAAFVSATVDDATVFCDQDGTLDSGETGSLVVTFKNTGHEPLNALTATVTTTTPGVTFGNGGALRFGSVVPFGTVSAPVPITLQNATGATPIDVSISYEDPGFAVPGARTQAVAFLGNYDETLGTSASDDVEAAVSAWTPGSDAALSTAWEFARSEKGLQDHVWFGPNPGSPADLWLQSPPLQVAQTGNFTFTFKHRWDFEADAAPTYYDGAVIEVSEDGGQTWTDVGAAAAGYNGTITDGQPTYASKNPLKNREAFVGKSAGYDTGAFVTTTIDLGTAYAGKAVLVRFRIGSDDASAATGWELDDLVFTNLANTPFNQRVADPGVCINRAPVAQVGADQQVDERTVATLDGSASTDPDGDPLTFTWTQLSGPAVALNGASFMAPEVTEDTDLTFQLVVFDGQLASAPAVAKVTVLQQNRGPTVSIAAPERAEEQAQFVLNAVTYDPENDPVDLTWTQLAGPTLPHEPTGTTLTVLAAEVTEDTEVAFQVEASDGEFTSTAEVRVVIRNVNHAPTANAGDDRTAAAGETVTLSGQGSDVDGDALVYTWQQVSGPHVELEAKSGGEATFVVPDAAKGQLLSFELTASDGAAAAVDRVNVSVAGGEQAASCGCAAAEGSQAGLGSLLLLSVLGLVARRRRLA